MNIFKDDFYIGKRFKYLDVTMLVVGFEQQETHIHNGGMYVDYIGANGTLVRHTFIENDHAAVVTELNRENGIY